MRIIRDGVSSRLRREHNERAWLAWHIEALRRAKRMPRLDKLTIRERRTRSKPQTWQEQLAVMTAWAGRVEKAINVRNQLNG